MYRILTERKNVLVVKAVLGHLGLDYTLYWGEGSWRGKPEPSILIELDNIAGDLAECAARMIGELNEQQAVLLQEIPTTSRILKIEDTESTAISAIPPHLTE